MNVVMTVAAADRLAEHAHGDDRNSSGVPYLEHVRRVAARMADDPDPHAVPAALLHDTVEKGALDWDDLRRAGADDRLIAVVDALTERDGESDRDYLARAAADPLALRIKRVDIADKLDAGTAVRIGPEAFERLEQRVRRRLALLEELADRR